MDNLSLIEKSEEIARAWVTAILNDDEGGEDRDIHFFFQNILLPYMEENGSLGGFALCEALASLAAVLADAAAVDMRPQEVIQMEISMED